MKYNVVILAAGQGTRMLAGKNKMFLDLLGMPVVVHTLLVFERDPMCEKIILVINPDEKESMEDWISTFKITKVSHFVPGGKERQDSVYQGLRVLPQQDESIVLIHDGARPLIDQKRVHNVVQAATQAGAAILAVPVKDTIKQVVGMKVEKTIERSSLWMVQTPQAFKYSLILQAHEHAKENRLTVTDDASMVEALEKEVMIVEGDYRNIKLTTPEDLLIAEQYLHVRRDRK